MRPAPVFAVCAILAVIVVAVAVGLGARASGPRAHVFEASVGDAHVRVVNDRAELIVRRLPMPTLGHIYELWIERGNGRPLPTSTLFSVTGSGEASIVVPGSVVGVSAVLVTEEPNGGSKVPTTAPVIVTHLS